MNQNLKVLLCVFLGSSFHALAQVKTEETKVEEPLSLPQKAVEGKFYPLFWNPVILKKKNEDSPDYEQEHAFIELAKVQTFAKQRYRVDANVVHEFSVALENKLFIRFYFVEDPIRDRLPSTLNINVDVVKTWPETTHKEMLEFRLTKIEDVDRLFKDFRKTYLDFKMNESVEDQRDDAVRQFIVKPEKEDN
jgi:hypothetical protein